MNGIDLAQQANRISDLTNPFMSDKVIAFRAYCNKSAFSGSWSYNGSIEFQNGNTKGEQKFSGPDFASLLKKMETFMAELEGEA